MTNRKAVVIGGSIAGLMAARVLSNHFATVTIIERDAVNAEAGSVLDSVFDSRKGVPQAEHLHILLGGGQQLIEQYFPGIADDLVKTGAEVMALSEDFHWFQHGAWKTNQACGITGLAQSRTSLEQGIRARVRQLPGVTIMDGCTVQGVIYDAAQETVTGVRVLRRDQVAGQETHIAADLVIDASGRGSRAIKWLEDLGYPAPPRESLTINLAYVTRIYKKTATSHAWKGLVVSPLPAFPRGGVLLPIDAERWIVTLLGYVGEHPPTQPDGFLAFAKALPVPDIYNALVDATQLTDSNKYQYPHSFRHRFDKLKRLPLGFLIIGDAMCSVDPVFGQGMSLSCKEAQALDRLLAAQRGQYDARRLRSKFFRACQKIIELPWLITQAEVLRFEKMPGPRPLKIRILHWYMNYVFALSITNAEVYRAFLELIHLKAGPEALFRPTVLSQVIGRMVLGPRG